MKFIESLFNVTMDNKQTYLYYLCLGLSWLLTLRIIVTTMHNNMIKLYTFWRCENTKNNKVLGGYQLTEDILDLTVNLKPVESNFFQTCYPFLKVSPDAICDLAILSILCNIYDIWGLTERVLTFARLIFGTYIISIFSEKSKIFRYYFPRVDIFFFDSISHGF